MKKTAVLLIQSNPTQSITCAGKCDPTQPNPWIHVRLWGRLGPRLLWRCLLCCSMLCHWATCVTLNWIHDKIPDFHLSGFEWNRKPDLAAKKPQRSGQINGLMVTSFLYIFRLNAGFAISYTVPVDKFSANRRNWRRAHSTAATWVASSRAGCKCVEALGRIIIRGPTHPQML